MNTTEDARQLCAKVMRGGCGPTTMTEVAILLVRLSKRVDSLENKLNRSVVATSRASEL